MNREVRREFIYLLDRMTPAQTCGVYLMLLFILAYSPGIVPGLFVCPRERE